MDSYSSASTFSPREENRIHHDWAEDLHRSFAARERSAADRRGDSRIGATPSKKK